MKTSATEIIVRSYKSAITCKRIEGTRLEVTEF